MRSLAKLLDCAELALARPRDTLLKPDDAEGPSSELLFPPPSFLYSLAPESFGGIRDVSYLERRVVDIAAIAFQFPVTNEFRKTLHWHEAVSSSGGYCDERGARLWESMKRFEAVSYPKHNAMQ